MYAIRQGRLVEAVEEFVNSGAQPAERMIRDIIECEHSYINTDHADFIGGSRAIAQVSARACRGLLLFTVLSLDSGEAGISAMISGQLASVVRSVQEDNTEGSCVSLNALVAVQVMERRQAAAEEAEEQGSEGSGRELSVHHRSGSSEALVSWQYACAVKGIEIFQCTCVHWHMEDLGPCVSQMFSTAI